MLATTKSRSVETHLAGPRQRQLEPALDVRPHPVREASAQDLELVERNALEVFGKELLYQALFSHQVPIGKRGDGSNLQPATQAARPATFNRPPGKQPCVMSRQEARMEAASGLFLPSPRPRATSDTASDASGAAPGRRPPRSGSEPRDLHELVG